MERTFHTLLDCPARFAGRYGSHVVQEFLEFVEEYKEIKCIQDQQALKELSYLLCGHAYSWWWRRKHLFNTWSEALTALYKQFAKRRPAYLVYADIFNPYSEEEFEVDDFIKDKVELFYELPEPSPTESMQFDIIYALMPDKKRRELNNLNINTVSYLTEHVNKQFHKTFHHTNNTIRKTERETKKHAKFEKYVKDCAKETVQYQKRPKQQCGNCEPEVNLSDDERGPVIKVKRTADLMPVINTIQHHEEMANENPKTIVITTNDGNSSFRIDSKLNNQLTYIIDTSESKTAKSPLPNSLVIDDSINPMQHVTYLLNGETTIAPEILQSPDRDKQQIIKEKEVTKKGKTRCSFCRHFGHRSIACFKKMKHMQLYPERFKSSKKNTRTTCQKNTLDTTATKNTNSSVNEAVVGPTILVQGTPSVLPNATQIDCNNYLATKLINQTINGPANPIESSLNKTCLNSSLDSKCHRCGTAGFYRSICPNCSPIYFYKPPPST